MAISIQQRRDTAANWASVNPVPPQGQICFLINGSGDVVNMKVGNGTDVWTALPYFISADSGLQYRGTWNASSNTPTLTSGIGTGGDYYIVGTGGATNLDGVTDWVVGDWVIFNSGNSSWQKIDQSNTVTSVFGRHGAVVATSGDYTASQVTNVPFGGITSTTAQAALDELDIKKLSVAGIRTAGCVVIPSFQDNMDGTVTIGTGQYTLYADQNYSGVPVTYTIAGGTFAVPDNVDSYILAFYNAGNPTLQLITSVPPANTTDSDRVPVFSMFRYGMDIHHFNWDHLALGLAEKLNKRFRRTDRFHIDTGLSLTETPTRIVDVSSGALWAGAFLIDLDSTNSTYPDTHFYYHTAGAWTRVSLSQYNNTQYDDGVDLVTLGNGKYAVNWIYRSVQQTGGLYVILGTGNYTLAQAQGSSEPPKPIEVSSQAKLVGRIIVLKDASTATQIDRATDVTFTSSAASNHNDLGGIQGGAADQYYHLTSADYTRIVTPSVRTTAISSAIVATDVGGVVTVSASGTTQTLPAASAGLVGKVFTIKMTTVGSLTVTVTGGDTIDGQTSIVTSGSYLSLSIACLTTSTWGII